MGKAGKNDFFVSYTQTDKAWATWIAKVLEKNGSSVIIQAWDFVNGNFVAQIDDALKAADRFVAVVSNAYFASDWCKAEWTAAFAKDPSGAQGLFLPVLIEPVTFDGLLRPVIYTSVFGKTDEAATEAQILTFVGSNTKERTSGGFPGSNNSPFPNRLPPHNLPGRNAYFTGREDILADIHGKFQSGDTVALTQAITGSGGVGKTQTAIEYAYRYGHAYKYICWINADTLSESFRRFAVAQRIVVEENSFMEETVRLAVQGWFRDNRDWLFIYDNAAGPDTIEPYRPGEMTGSLLITTRNRTEYQGELVDISVFRPEEAVDFLRKRIHAREFDAEDAGALAERLGYFPLALEQAAAYMFANNITCEEYSQLLEEYGVDLLREEGKFISYEDTIVVTWQISFDKIQSESAKQLLNLCAYFAPDNIPLTFFAKGAEWLPEPLKSDVGHKLKFNAAVKELTKYCLVTKKKSGTIFIHRLMQEVIRDSLKEDASYAAICVDLMRGIFEYEYGNLALMESMEKESAQYLAVCDNTVKLLEADEERQEKIAWLYHEVASAFDDAGRYSQALAIYRKSLAIKEKIKGKEDPSTATTYNNIAVVYKNQGEYEKALEWHEKALGIKLKVLGKEHPETAVTYDNIGQVYDDLGEYEKALEWYRKALNICEKGLGKEHPHTATTYNNIALVYDNQGEYEKAMEWYRRALDVYEKVLGEDHPHIATTYHNIAAVYYSQGKYEKALEWHEKALVIYEKVLGKEHPDTATTYNNIAYTYENQGQYEEALEGYQKALDIWLKVLGENHPSTKRTINNITRLKEKMAD